MSEDRESGSPPPPEVPEEFSAAYRAAYEEALRSHEGGAHPASWPPSGGRTTKTSPLLAWTRKSAWLLPVFVGVVLAVVLVVVLLATLG